MRCIVFSVYLLAAVGCVENGGLGTDNPDGTGDPTDTANPDDDIPWSPESDGSEIWELAFPKEVCEGFTDTTTDVFTPVAGATRYFAGDYDIDLEAETVQGREYWLLRSNERWRELGEADCQVVWSVSGTVGPPSCAICDYSISITATIQPTESNCPDGLQDIESDWSAAYDVYLTNGGDSEFLFLESQNDLGSGWWTGDRVAWISNSACMFF